MDSKRLVVGKKISWRMSWVGRSYRCYMSKPQPKWHWVYGFPNFPLQRLYKARDVGRSKFKITIIVEEL